MADRKIIALCTPTITRPYPAYLEAVEASVKVMEAAGYDVRMTFTLANPYISAARAEMLRKALDGKADVIVFLDHDLSWRPADLLTLVETEGDVVAGLYRFKKDEPEYMGAIATDQAGRPVLRPDGCMKATRIPAGFLKITKEAVDRFMTAYPELAFGPKFNPSIDLFNHGAHEGVWWGEDYAFSRRWIAAGGDIWVVPDLNLDHHSADKAYPGNFHEFMMAQPGGANDPARAVSPAQAA